MLTWPPNFSTPLCIMYCAVMLPQLYYNITNFVPKKFLFNQFMSHLKLKVMTHTSMLCSTFNQFSFFLGGLSLHLNHLLS